MARILVFLITIAIILTSSVTAQRLQATSDQVEIVRTKLSDKTCQNHQNPDEGNGVLGTTICIGTAGFKIVITNLEHGQSLNLMSPDGKESYLELFEPMGVESYIGNEIEWRIVRNGDSVNVKAIMFNRKVFRRGYSEENPRTKIAVFKIMGDAACLIADLKTDELKKALEFASDPAKHSCYSAPDAEPVDLSDTLGVFELPGETNFEDAQNKRFKYFYDDNSDRATLVLERFYPIGWSKDGKFAYLIESADIACDCFNATIIAKDIHTNKTIWKFSHEEPLDPSDKSYETGDTQEYRASFWKNNQKSLSEKLKSYGIVPIENAQLLKLPVKYKKDEINVRIEISRDADSEYDYPQNLSKIEVKATSNQTKTKKLFEENFETRDTFSYVEEADVFGYFQSPFEPLIAIVIVKVGRGQHGTGPNPTSVEILGFDVSRGLD